MRSIDLSDYRVKAAPYGIIGDGAQEELTYDVRHSLIEVLFTSKLTPRELLEMDAIATKIRDCPDSSLVLDEPEYSKVIETMEVLRLFGPTDVEFVRRILKAEKVEVAAK